MHEQLREAIYCPLYIYDNFNIENVAWPPDYILVCIPLETLQQ